MKIKKLRISDNGKKRIAALLLTGVTLVTAGGCRSSNDKITEEEIEANKTKVFDVGEHVISVPVANSAFTDIRQYRSVAGYTVVGIANDGHDDTMLLFVNSEPVECCCTGIYDNVFVYSDFGVPIGKTKNVSVADYKYSSLTFSKDDSEYVTYDVGEHIIVVTSCNIDAQLGEWQYDYHDGYDVVGFGSQRGKYGHHGCSVLYVNNVPVECELTFTNSEDYDATYVYNFGTPVNAKVFKR